MAVTLEDRLVVGDETALRDLFDQYAALLAAIGEEVLGPDRSDQVGEAIADVLAGVWKGRDTFDPSKGSVRSWVVSTMRTRLAVEQGVHILTLDADYGKAIDRHLVASVIDAMPDVRRELVKRALFEGQSEEQMANEFDLPVGTVAGHLRVGFEFLRDELANSLVTDSEPLARLQAVVTAGELERWSVPPSSAVWDLVALRSDAGSLTEPVGDDPEILDDYDVDDRDSREALDNRDDLDNSDDPDSPDGDDDLDDADEALSADEWVDGFDNEPPSASAEAAWGTFMSADLGQTDKFFADVENDPGSQLTVETVDVSYERRVVDREDSAYSRDDFGHETEVGGPLLGFDLVDDDEPMSDWDQGRPLLPTNSRSASIGLEEEDEVGTEQPSAVYDSPEIPAENGVEELQNAARIQDRDARLFGMSEDTTKMLLLGIVAVVVLFVVVGLFIA